MKLNGQIYMISINNFNYIGQSIGSSLCRWSNHLRLLNNNKHHCKLLQSQFDFYGIESLSFKILKNKIEKEELNNFEIYFTKQFNGINALPLNFLKEEKKKLILNDIILKIPYRKIAKIHNVSLGTISKIKSIYM